MSAFICGDKCFEYILDAMFDNWGKCVRKIARLGKEDEQDENFIKGKLVWFGNELRKMNVKSVNARYGENTRNQTADFVISHLKSDTTDEYRKELACAVKQIHCLMYQSCEFDGYEKDWRWKALETVLGILSDQFVTLSKEYENCNDWGF